MLKMIEPAMIIFLGLAVLFIVASLFMPLISIISGLTGNKG
jgi:type IV pilus assembly protein PilC